MLCWTHVLVLASVTPTVVACANTRLDRDNDSSTGSHDGSRWGLCGATLARSGAAVDVEIEGSSIVAVLAAGDSTTCASSHSRDLSGQFIAPSFIDSHVHLAYFEVAGDLAAGGISAAIDLAAPLEFMTTAPGPLRVMFAGPMLTTVGGYPTQSWGAGGFGLEVADTAAARRAVDVLHGHGARVVKLALVADGLTDDVVTQVVERATELGMLVAAHAVNVAPVTNMAL